MLKQDLSDVMLKIGFKSFPRQTENRAIDSLVYGLKLKKLSRWGKATHLCLFYILEDDEGTLQWLSQKKLYSKSRIDLKAVTNLYDNVSEVYHKFEHLKKELLLRIVTNGNKELVLLFSNEEDKQMFQQGIQYFILKAIKQQLNGNTTQNITQHLFKLADKDNSQNLSFDEVKRILKRMHIEVSGNFLKKFYLKYDVNRNGSIENEEFKLFIDDLMQKKEIWDLFQIYSKGNANGITFASLQQFYEKEQKQQLPISEIIDLVQSLGETGDSVSFYTFVNLIFSPLNTIIDNEQYKQKHDMSKPLTMYYMHSSHNTYLLSNQLTGKSSLQAYINAFKKGVKCVELDCWDGKDGEPVVYHGHTLTSKIYFKDILECVLQHGFSVSPYPVLLSFEIHCGADQQLVMVKHIKNILKHNLYIISPEMAEATMFPSPQELINKVLIKGVGNIHHLHPVFKNSEIIDFVETPENEDEKIEELMQESESETAQMDMYMSVEDEISFQEHNNKHKVPDTPKLPSALYTRFNVHNPDFMNYLNYHQYLDQQSKSVQASSRQSSELPSPHQPYCIADGSWINEDQWKARQNIQHKSTSTPKVPQPVKGILKHPPMDESRKMSVQQQTFGGYSQLRKQTYTPSKKKVIHGTHIELEKCLTLFSARISFDPKRLIWLITSFSETQLEEVWKKNQAKLIKYHKRYFSRIYPKGTRFDSSNYDPMPGYVVGSQIVALNYQTTDENLLLNMTMFQRNNNEGYVLKPEFLIEDFKKTRSQSQVYQDTSQFYDVYFKTPRLRLIMHFMSAQQLRPENESQDEDVVDPFIEVSVKGIPIDEQQNGVMRSNVVKNNGFNPIFNFTVDVSFNCPALGFIVIKVFDSNVMNNDRLGINILAVNALRSGYRVIPLLNSKLNVIDYCYILVHLEIIKLF